jgi:T-complex protein 1 subunit eta
VNGVAFKKTFSYAGFEQQPKKFTNPKILCLNIELELKAERENAEMRIEDPKTYQSFVDAEWKIIYEKLDKIVKSGAQVVLSRLAGRVPEEVKKKKYLSRLLSFTPSPATSLSLFSPFSFVLCSLVCFFFFTRLQDLRRVCKATGAAVQSTVNDVIPAVLGTCSLFEEHTVGGERYNFFTGCSGASATIILRGGGEQFIDEAERSIHDSIMIVRRARQHSDIVAGGGAAEMEVSKYLREHARNIHGKQQLIINAFAKALEIIPRQIADNSGFDSTDILNKLRQKHNSKDEGSNCKFVRFGC